MNKNLILTIAKIIFVLLVVYFGNMIFENYYKSLEKNYTVGVLGEKYRIPNQGSRINFHFTYWGEKFHSDNFIGSNEISKGQVTYLIEVPIKDIKKSRILWDYPVPDTLKAPYEGWDEIPEFLKKQELFD
ncbi:hypothetical protein SAMN04488057_1126 [Cyclobacterium lianum]|uniref:Uncharacterized protein n=1 Tax=Cyclobacterium lianum TaxID=388280 RepID=A0A1M7PY45_9BACT|nr:hypothetical protein [Cyclobacterium lianum]SHN22734.1 hypothetical protein SAMN04488057_1126 [Cyclobacterium lianum]